MLSGCPVYQSVVDGACAVAKLALVWAMNDSTNVPPEQRAAPRDAPLDRAAQHADYAARSHGSVQRASDFFTRAQIKQLIAPSPWRGLLLVAHCWLMILAIWGVGYYTVTQALHPLLQMVVLALCVLLIGARQLGLAILNHDGAHFTLHPNKALNDWVSQWLLNRPLFGGSVLGYRRYHLDHHRFTQQDNDPDLHLSAKFPLTKSSFRRKLWRDLSGQTGFKQYSALFKAALDRGATQHDISAGPGMGGSPSGFWSRFGPNLVINLALFGGFALAGVWYLYVLLWVVPAFTWERFITRLRNIGEHAVVPDNNDRLRNTRTVLASWWECALIAPYYVNYHLEHHLLVSCPCYRLPAAHRLLMDAGFGPKMETKPGYIALLRVALSKPEAALV